MESIDLSDDLSFRKGFPHDYFTWLRKNNPIYWHEPTDVTPDKEGFWVVCCYEDVNYVLRNPTIFSSDKAGERVGGGTGIKDEKTAGKLLNQSDGAQHRRLRALVQKGFTLKAVQELEDVLRNTARTIFRKLKIGDKLDFAVSISPEIPTQAICTVLGVPEKDRKDLCEWIDLGIEVASTSVIASEYLAKIRNYSKSLIETNQKIQAESDRKLSFQTQIADQEAMLSQLKADLISKEKLLASRQKTLNEHVNKIRSFESEKKIKNERLRFLEDRSQKLREQIDADRKSNAFGYHL